ncbi:MAG: 4-amino-4-deoxychorismate lyase [Bacteroidetes bacterium]|nr:MAG: 4-amino-4-deoxychorismate lyase [Bacteroidota bacterium]
MQYYIFSGEMRNIDDGISIKNRAFRYADGLFESMFFTNNKIMFLDLHYNRLLEGMKLLQIETSNLPDKQQLIDKTRELIKANGIESAARVRLQVFRKDGGLYLPDTNDCEYLLEATAIDNNEYTLNTKGLHIGITTKIKQHKSIFSKVKTIAKQEMIIAALDARENKWDDAILTNTSNNITETSSSNIFAVINGNLYTPQIDDGILDGIMRQMVLKIVAENNIPIIETSLTEANLEAAEEIFITNAVKGVQWVVAFGNKRFFNNMSKRIISLLNKKIYE